MIRRFRVGLLTLGATMAISIGLDLGAGRGAAMADEATSWKINGSIDVAPSEHRGNLSTINGSIHVGEDATVGELKTVNGNLSVEPRVTASTVTTVNGSIDVHDGVHVQGFVHTTNGSIHVRNAADVAGDVTNTNGNIHIASAHVGGSIDTSAGNIDLGPNAHIDGGVSMEEDNSWHFGFQNLPRVVVEPGTIIKGKLRFKRPVKLYVSDHATIGPVEGAEVVKFSGDHPPE
jgi:DUF4097 and DUF4098 domain-containing protein YvlB